MIKMAAGRRKRGREEKWKKERDLPPSRFITTSTFSSAASSASGSS